jgi:ubiquinone/menaquinone biosynthesis C-methylase UbiE
MVRAAAARGVNALLGDAEALPFPDASFALSVGIGLLPWLCEPLRGLRELARVTSSSGHVLVTADNPHRLPWLLDPRFSPLHAPLRRAVRRHDHQVHTPRQTDRLLRAAGLEKVDGETIGFGPLTFLGRQIVASFALERRLQQLADRDVPLLRAAGRQYLVLARA